VFDAPSGLESQYPQRVAQKHRRSAASVKTRLTGEGMAKNAGFTDYKLLTCRVTTHV